MKVNFLKGASLFLAATFALSSVPNSASAATMFSANPFSSASNTANTSNTAMDQLQNQMNQQFNQEQMDQLMNQQNSQDQKAKQKESDPKKEDPNVKKNSAGHVLVSAKGYVTNVNGDFYIGIEYKDPYQIVVQEDSDVEVVSELVADVQMPVTYEGYLDEKTKKIYVHSLVLNKQPSKRLETKINEALDEWEKTRPVSAKGYIIQQSDGNFYFKVGKKYYLLDPQEKDLELALDLIVEEEIMLVQLTGLLEDLDESPKTKTVEENNSSEGDSTTAEGSETNEGSTDSETAEEGAEGSDTSEETNESSETEEESTPTESETTSKVDTSNLSLEAEKIFKITGLTFLEQLDKEFLDNLNSELFKSKDGTEVKINGYVYSDGDDIVVEFNDKSMKLVPDGTYDEVPLILDLVKDTELKTTVVGVLDIASNTIKTKRLDIVDVPSTDLAKEINEILSEYAEGEALARGYVVSTSNGYGLKIEEKIYEISILKEENKETGETAEIKNVREFLEIIKDTETFIQAQGLISTKNLTFEVYGASVIGIPEDDNVRAQLGALIAPELKIPETGSKMSAEGYIVKKNNNYYISIAFNDFLLKTEDPVVARLLPILEREELVVGVEGIVDAELKLVNATYVQLLQEPTDEVLAELKAAAEGKETAPITAGSPTSKTETNTASSNSNTGNVLPFQSLMSTLGGNGGSNGSLFTSLMSNSALSSQSYDQMLSRLNSLLTTSKTDVSANSTTSQNSGATNSTPNNSGLLSGLFGSLSVDEDTTFKTGE